MTDAPNDDAIARTILDLVAARAEGASICPSEAARALAPEWRPLLGPVRRVAAALAQGGQIDILRKGKPIDPAEMRGVIRLRARSGGEEPPTAGPSPDPASARP